MNFWKSAALGLATAAVAALSVTSQAMAEKRHKIYLSMSYIGNDWQAEAANMLKAMAASKEYADKVDLKVQVAGPNAQKQIQQINAMVQAGAQAVRVKRRVDNHTTPSASYDTAFDHVAPKLGVLYALTPTAQAYANVSGSDEVPPIGEMVVRPQWPLGHPQKATTVEAGWRGRAGDLSWDMAAYHALVHRAFTAQANVRNVRTVFSVHRAKFETRIDVRG